MIRLDLRDYLARDGFVLDEKDSSPNSFKMRGPTCSLVVKQREDGVWVYFNLSDRSDNGTIIEYIKRRCGAGLRIGHIKEHVRGKLGDGFFRGPIVPGVPRPVVHAPRDLSQVAAKWRAAGPIWGLPYYLKSRGLSADTVSAYASALKMDERGNILFSHTNEQGQVVGYEVSGFKFKGFGKGGVRLICRLGPLEGGEPVKIALTESGVDALSLAQLVGRRDALFCSTGGALSRHTLGQITALAAKHPAAEILLAFDNDDAGEAFAKEVKRALQGREKVRRLLPKLKDWNDQLRARPSSGSAQTPAP